MPSEVQILKESKARFEGVIFNQTADLGTNKSTSCKVIDEATGEVIAQSGGGGGGDSNFTTAEVTFVLPEGTEEVDSFAFIQTIEEDETGEGEPAVLYVGILPITNNSKRTVPLYNGLTVISLPSLATSDYSIGSVTGDAEFNSVANNLSITGDCTIALVAK